MVAENLLDPVSSDGTPAGAYASHKARANGIAEFIARNYHLADIPTKQVGENETLTMIAHCHMLQLDPNFTPDGQAPSAIELPAAISRLNKGNALVGTTLASTKRDYDMAIKGLVVMLYRYRDVLTQLHDFSGRDLFSRVMTELIPAYFNGSADPSYEVYDISFLEITAPETENHLLMINSGRYLINQILAETKPDAKYDNSWAGQWGSLRDYLLRFLHNIQCHDFLEFHARPYTRMSTHALLNLYEFAKDPVIRTAAQMILDYLMVKFALSSSRGRRVTPYRRHQHRINHQANFTDYLYDGGGDQFVGFFLAATGLVGRDLVPQPLPGGPVLEELLGSLSSYRPPPAAYTLALSPDVPSALHRFYSGARPRLRASADDADSSLEIYHRSPSFLISAGGSFLNSGYGKDQTGWGDKTAWAETSRAQATTIIPTQHDTAFFHDLVRFEAYPDPRRNPYYDYPDSEDGDCLHASSVNYGVVRGFAAGANMRPGERKTVLEEATSAASALALHKGTLYVGWKGVDNNNLNIAMAQCTTVMGIDGVEGTTRKVVLTETSESGPALASHQDRLFVAWRGTDDRLNIAFSDDAGVAYALKVKGKNTLRRDKSTCGPALASHNGRLYLAWTGTDDRLNIARVKFGNNAGGFAVDGIENKVTLRNDKSESAPALASHGGRLFLAWCGTDDRLNVVASDDSGQTFHGKNTLRGDKSEHGPALASHNGRLHLAWTGTDSRLNIAKVILIGSTAGGFGIEGIEEKVTLTNDKTGAGPGLGAWKSPDNVDLLCLAWRGDDDNLVLRVSRDGNFGSLGPWIFVDRSNLGFYLVAYRTPPAQPDQLVEPLDSLGFVHVLEKDELHGMSFADYRERVKVANRGLPTRLQYGGHYTYTTVFGRQINMWFEFTGQKYAPRVVDLADPVVDFTTLPLVSGEFMTAPGSHDGLLEVSMPGCPQPCLVLDFRDPLNPIRTEDKNSCPQPWLDRTTAMFQAAKDFHLTNRRWDERTARSDASVLYGEMLELNAALYGSVLTPAVLDALAAMGIDNSLPAADIQTALSDPGTTSYPAIAQSLLGLGCEFHAAVDLPCIVLEYGLTQPHAHSAADVNAQGLRTAIVASWNARYGTTYVESDFEQLLLP